jgi:pilus assembly protein Flp/PilA
MTRLRAARGDDDGASAVEYALLLAAIAAVLVAIVFALGTITRGQYASTCSAWDTAAGTTSC